ncbi:YopJ family acetyltransferase [Mesorhizobium tamadayense]|uniref:YopJ family acetyltransferase n=1 Tax=Mesorhizobium tamadayense TaxID=425306 RepID=UPI0024797241|nr:YopJ family acetyltransferase [Mesorhizobium tamadayense]
MGGCISRMSGRRETHQDYRHSQETEFAAHLESAQSSSPRSSFERPLQSTEQSGSGNASSRSRSSRVNEKIELLGQTLERARQTGTPSSLMEYGRQVAHYLSANTQPDERILSLDINNFHHLAASYNRRYPELDLRHMDSPATFLDTLNDRSRDRAWRAVVRLSDGEKHHFAADVRTRAGAAPTVIVMEGANFYTFVAPHFKLRAASLEQLGAEPQWAFIEIDAQKSAADCVMFGLQFALAAHRESPTFDSWHDNLHQHGTMAREGDCSSDFMPSPDAMLEYAQINLFHGERFLPAPFYKHSHSSSVIAEVAGHQPGIKERDVSTSRRDPKTESLANRLEAFAVQRGSRQYSASIETSRATKIRTALNMI